MRDCPSCDESFDTERGVKIHHKRVHNESIAGVAVDCDWCGTTFYKKPSYVERYEHLFCGRDCKDAFHSDYLTGRERPEHAELMSEMYQGQGNPMWNGGGQSGRWRSTAKWQKTRERVLDRDNRECQVCQDSEELHAHHIQPVSDGGKKFDTDNLITLCAEHHYQEHSNE